MRHTSPLMLVALVLSCDSLSGRATGPRYQGEPLAVVNGRMTADQDISITGDVRLGVAWFISGAIGQTRPDAVLTQDVIYEAVFPVGFSFGLYDLPPAGIGSVEGPGGVQAAAFGFLIAYVDRTECLRHHGLGVRPTRCWDLH